MPDPLILVTEPEYRKGEGIYQNERRLEFEPAPGDEPSLVREVEQRRAMMTIVGTEPYTGPLYEALARQATDGRALIARFGVGCNNIDFDRAAACGVVIRNTPGALDRSVAEQALWLIGAAARAVASADARVRQGGFTNPTGIELSGKTLGIFGLGPIGRRLAQIAHHGLEMRVLGVDCRSPAEMADEEQRPLDEFLARYGLDSVTSDADAVLAEADVVSLHLPGTDELRHFMGARRLAAMRPGSILVNTARGMLVDEAALFDAIQSNQLAAAGLDVFEREPYEPVDPARDLRTLSSVVLTPHTSSNTHAANRRMAHMTVDAVRAFLQETE